MLFKTANLLLLSRKDSERGELQFEMVVRMWDSPAEALLPRQYQSRNNKVKIGRKTH